MTSCYRRGDDGGPACMDALGEAAPRMLYVQYLRSGATEFKVRRGLGKKLACMPPVWLF